MSDKIESYDVVIVGGTPAGVAAAISAARAGCTAIVLERTGHVGGLPANGLGATDIATRGATKGLFLEFVQRNHKYYVDKYGKDSEQAKVSADGYHFEPSVGEQTLLAMIRDAGPKVTVKLMCQFDADPANVKLTNGRLSQVTITDRNTGKTEQYAGKVFVDATYEGDLAAAAGAPYMLGREGVADYNEPMAGVIYKEWKSGGVKGEGSTGLGDNAIQSYNYRVCLTDDPSHRLPIEKPKNYNAAEYASHVDDILNDRVAGKRGGEWFADGIGWTTNVVPLPNRKTDANNQHLAFLSTDLPEENWPWPTSSWDWRDKFAVRLREYILGLFWTVQNDPKLPEAFKAKTREWGLSKQEYADNGHFPRQVYVREGRRIVGDYLFTAHDAVPVKEGARPPVHADSVTASHYPLDSHACHKREPGRCHCEGFLSYPSAVYTVPYRIMLPKKVEGLLTPVTCSATHIGLSTLRMEPCWIALGQAAGAAAGLAVKNNQTPRQVDVKQLQKVLLGENAVLFYFKQPATSKDADDKRQIEALAAGDATRSWDA